jgi:hypothetical protein
MKKRSGLPFSWRLDILTPILGTELENLSVAQTVISTGNSIRDVLAFNYASQALNNSFFFDNLVSILVPIPSVVLIAVTASTREVATTTHLILHSSFGNPNLPRTHHLGASPRAHQFIIRLAFLSQILHVRRGARHDVLRVGLAGLRRKCFASCCCRYVWPRDHARPQ